MFPDPSLYIYKILRMHAHTNYVTLYRLQKADHVLSRFSFSDLCFRSEDFLLCSPRLHPDNAEERPFRKLPIPINAVNFLTAEWLTGLFSFTFQDSNK